LKPWLERRWYTPGRSAPLALRPVAALYGAISQARRVHLQAVATRVPAPVIIVGNISVGGTGKTPFTIWLVERLRDWGWSPGVVSRGYGGRPPQLPYAVPPEGDPRFCGDEPLLIAQRAKCPVIVDPDRVAAARALLRDHTVDIIISDDGLQHYRLARDLEIGLVDGRRGLGNGALLPAGPLRERPARLDELGIVVVNGDGWTRADAVRMQLVAAPLRRLIDGETRALESWRGQRLHAVAGIGNPRRFFDSLTAAGIEIDAHAFDDHHAYVAGDFAFADAAPVVMTEKDAVKCRPFADSRMWALPVTVQIDESDAMRVRECVDALRHASRR
jgi:tetraacyldisaccharide 4'-kinase